MKLDQIKGLLHPITNQLGMSYNYRRTIYLDSKNFLKLK